MQQLSILALDFLSQSNFVVVNASLILAKFRHHIPKLVLTEARERCLDFG